MKKQSNPSPPDIKLNPPPPSIGIFREDGGPGAPATLLGKAFAIDEDMPDIAANAHPIVFGDFMSYANQKLRFRLKFVIS